MLLGIVPPADRTGKVLACNALISFVSQGTPILQILTGLVLLGALWLSSISRTPGVESSLAAAILPAGTRGRRRSPADPTPGPEVCASYARFSSDLQHEASITDQQRKCRERAERDGLSITPEREFADEAVSGTKSDRTGLNALMAAARQGGIRRLYVESLSRLARESVISMTMLKELVHVCRVRVISVSEGIDSATDSWEILATVQSLNHEQFIKSLRTAVLRGQEGTVLAGHSVGDWCFGYTSEPIPGTTCGRGRNAKPRMRYCIDPETAPWVGRIFAWLVTERRSIRWIAKELSRQNAPKDHRSTTPCSNIVSAANRTPGEYAGRS